MRSGFEGWRPPKGCNDAQLRSRLKPLAEPYPKYGCPTLHDILVIEGDVVNKTNLPDLSQGRASSTY
jgi:hypothetical protein